jgi:archaellum biogenesis ATPase FlaH
MPIELNSASELCDALDTQSDASVKDDFFRGTLGHILQAGGIAEVFGPSGTGKSTFAMQTVISMLAVNQEWVAAYICTDSPFRVDRFRQLCGDDISEQQFMNLASRVIVEHIGSLEAQEHLLCFALEPLARQNQLKIVVVDSISSNFRVCARSKDVTSSLYSMAHSLNVMAHEQDIRILCINQITDIMKDDDKSWKVPFRPALGLSWSNSICSRIMISRLDGEPASVRVVSVIRSPTAKPEDMLCMLGQRGFYSFQIK